MATWGDEVEARAAIQGLRLVDVAARMHVEPERLSIAFTLPEITEAFFLRVTAALRMKPEDWDVPIRDTPTLVRARQRRANLRRLIRAEKKRVPE